MTIALASYTLGAFFLFALLLSQVRIWSQGNSSFVLLSATLVTFIWCVSLAMQAGGLITSLYPILALEVVRNTFWFALLLSILGIRKALFEPLKRQENRGLLWIAGVSLGFPAVFLLTVFFSQVGGDAGSVPVPNAQALLSGLLLMPIIGLVLLEQVIRNARYYHHWHLKFLCLGLGIVFCFDLYMYSDAMLFGRIYPPFWEGRGFILILSTPLIALGVFRTNRQPIQINISRRLVFHSGVLLAAGVYLLLMASAGFYIRSNSGDWGVVLQAMFWLVSLSLLFILTLSGRLRSLIKVYISRNLFSSRYDYREEWLRISRRLSQADSDDSLAERAIHAMADIVDSGGGALWLTRDGRHYDQVAEVEMGWLENSDLTEADPLIRFLQEKNCIIDLTLNQTPNLSADERSGDPQGPEVLPSFLTGLDKAWLIVPLMLHERLLGFILLRHSRIEIDLNWEDFDLLKTAAQQTASYLSQMTATEALSEARQFSAFNQMSAFVVHDIKTLNSQLSLMVSNSAQHKDNPLFIEDMIKTTDHAVQKMRFLLQHFSNEGQANAAEVAPVDLVELLERVVESHKHLKPVPVLRSQLSEAKVEANEMTLQSAIGHLVRNAQEATPDDGEVTLLLEDGEDEARVIIRDTGAGMTQEFIKTRLFRPFESTKGLSGMGVGVYQSRETIRRLGGELRINSEPGRGTEFVLTLARIHTPALSVPV